MPAQGILEEFQRIRDDVTTNPSLVHMWAPILNKMWPTLITSSQHAVDWADKLLRTYLSNCMLAGVPTRKRTQAINRIADLLGKQKTSKTHNRHISQAKAREIGLEVVALEDDQQLQDLVITLHHALTHTFTQTGATKIIENHLGVAYVNKVQAMRVN